MPYQSRYTIAPPRERRAREQPVSIRIPIQMPQQAAAPARIAPKPRIQRDENAGPKIVPAQQEGRGRAAPAVTVKLPQVSRNPRIAGARPSAGAAPKIKSVPRPARELPQRQPKIVVGQVSPGSGVGKLPITLRPEQLRAPPRIIVQPAVESRTQLLAREAPAVREYYLQQALEAARAAPNPTVEQRNKVARLRDLYNKAVRNPQETMEEARKRVEVLNANAQDIALARDNRSFMQRFTRYAPSLASVGEALWAVGLPAAVAAGRHAMDIVTGKEGIGKAAEDATNEAFRRAWLQYAPPSLQGAIRFSDRPASGVLSNLKDTYRIPATIGANLNKNLNKTVQETIEDMGLSPGTSRRIAPELQQRRLDYIKSSAAEVPTKMGGVLLGAYRKTLNQMIDELPGTVYGATINKNYLRTAADTVLLNAFGPAAISFAEDLRRIGQPNTLIPPNLTEQTKQRQSPYILPINLLMTRGDRPKITAKDQLNTKFEPITKRVQPRVVRPQDFVQQQQFEFDIPDNIPDNKQPADVKEKQEEATLKSINQKLKNAQEVFDNAYRPFSEAKQAYLSAGNTLLEALDEWQKDIAANPLHGDLAYLAEINQNKTELESQPKILKLTKGNLANVFTDLDAALNYYYALKKSPDDGAITPAQRNLFNAMLAKRRYEQFGLNPVYDDYVNYANTYYDSAKSKLNEYAGDLETYYKQLKQLFSLPRNGKADINGFYAKTQLMHDERLKRKEQGMQPKSVYYAKRDTANKQLMDNVDKFMRYISNEETARALEKAAKLESTGYGEDLKNNNARPKDAKGFIWGDLEALFGFNKGDYVATPGVFSLIGGVNSYPYQNDTEKKNAYLNLALTINQKYRTNLGKFASLKELLTHISNVDKANESLHEYDKLPPTTEYYDDSGETKYYTTFAENLKTILANIRSAQKAYNEQVKVYYPNGVFVPPERDNAYKNFKNYENKMRDNYFVVDQPQTQLDIRYLQQRSEEPAPKIDTAGIRNLMQTIDPEDTLKINQQKIFGIPWLDVLYEPSTLASLIALGLPTGWFALSRSGIHPELVDENEPRRRVELSDLTAESPPNRRIAALETYLNDNPEIPPYKFLSPSFWSRENLFGGRSSEQPKKEEKPEKTQAPMNKSQTVTVPSPMPDEKDIVLNVNTGITMPDVRIKTPISKTVRENINNQPIDWGQAGRDEILIDENEDKPLNPQLPKKVNTVAQSLTTSRNGLEPKQRPTGIFSGFLTGVTNGLKNVFSGSSNQKQQAIELANDTNPEERLIPRIDFAMGDDMEAQSFASIYPPPPRKSGNLLTRSVDAFNELAFTNRPALPQIPVPSTEQLGQYLAPAGRIIQNNLSNVASNISNDVLNYGERTINNTINTGINAGSNFLNRTFNNTLGFAGNMMQTAVQGTLSRVPFGHELYQLGAPYLNHFANSTANQLSTYAQDRIQGGAGYVRSMIDGHIIPIRKITQKVFEKKEKK